MNGPFQKRSGVKREEIEADFGRKLVWQRLSD